MLKTGLATLACVLAAASPALAQAPVLTTQWVLLSASPTTVIYIDKATLAKSGPYARVTSLVIASQPMTLADHKAAMVWTSLVIDCGARTAQLVKAVGYDSDGGTVSQLLGGPAVEGIKDGSPVDAASVTCDEDIGGPTFPTLAAAYGDARYQMAQAKTARELPQGGLTLSVAVPNAALFVIDGLTKKTGASVDTWLFEVYDPANPIAGGEAVMGVSHQIIDCIKHTVDAEIWAAFDNIDHLLETLPGEDVVPIDPASPLNSVANTVCGSAKAVPADRVTGYGAALEMGRKRILAAVAAAKAARPLVAP